LGLDGKGTASEENQAAKSLEDRKRFVDNGFGKKNNNHSFIKIKQQILKNLFISNIDPK
jgi:hypothetical protein